MAYSSFYKGNAIQDVCNQANVTNFDVAPPCIETRYGIYNVRYIHPLELLPKDKDSNVYLRGLVLEWYFTFSSLPVITDRSIHIYHPAKYEFEYLVGQTTRDKVERVISDYIAKHNPKLLIPVHLY